MLAQKIAQAVQLDPSYRPPNFDAWYQVEFVEGGQGNVVAVPLHPFAKTDVGEGVLPVDSLALCTLVVRVPNDVDTSTGDFEFAVLQLFEGEEIRRVTYRFGQITWLR